MIKSHADWHHILLHCPLTLNEQPVVDHCLDVGVEETGDVMAHLQVGDVDQGAGRRSQGLLTQDTHNQLTVLHNHLTEGMQYATLSTHASSPDLNGN